jgi:SAM-dependent methyltransferase
MFSTLNKIPGLMSLIHRFALWLHNFAYKLLTKAAIYKNNGIHPKHDIIQYEKWFLGQIQDGDVVLDVGCNTGSLPRELSSKAQFVYGIELDQKNYQKAKSSQGFENIQWILGDATEYNYQALKPINVVTLSNVLEHVERRVEFLQKILHQVKWANDHKKLLIRVPMIDREWTAVYKKQQGAEWRLDPTHYTEYTFGQFEDELKEAGVQIDRYHIRFGEIFAVCSA